eukprot:m.351842 g.351842  ORF g.351842 m.351842 type:complete len:469 (-) comp16374_c0_seq1:242-1648(-)
MDQQHHTLHMPDLSEDLMGEFGLAELDHLTPIQLGSFAFDLDIPTAPTQHQHQLMTPMAAPSMLEDMFGAANSSDPFGGSQLLPTSTMLSASSSTSATDSGAGSSTDVVLSMSAMDDTLDESASAHTDTSVSHAGSPPRLEEERHASPAGYNSSDDQSDSSEDAPGVPDDVQDYMALDIAGEVVKTKIRAPSSRPFAQRANQNSPMAFTDEEFALLRKEGWKYPRTAKLNKDQEKELKKLRRKIKNKISAQESRTKRRQYTKILEEKVRQEKESNVSLKANVKSLREENSSLLSQLRLLQSKLSKLTGNSATSAGTALMLVGLCFSMFTPGQSIASSSASASASASSSHSSHYTAPSNFHSRTLHAAPASSIATAASEDAACLGLGPASIPAHMPQDLQRMTQQQQQQLTTMGSAEKAELEQRVQYAIRIVDSALAQQEQDHHHQNGVVNQTQTQTETARLQQAIQSA